MSEEPNAAQGTDSAAKGSDSADKGPDAAATTSSAKKWVPWIIAGVACVVALVAVVYAVQAGRDTSKTGGPISLSGSAKSSASGSSGGTGGTSTGSSGSSSAKPGAPGASGSAGSAPGSQPGTRTPGGAAPTIAAAGSRLVTITVPPTHTVGLLKVPTGVKTATYAVTFKPYGWGPGGPERGNLVVAVSKSTPAGGDATKLLDLTGKNASFWASPSVASAIKVGGTYSGSVAVKVEGDTGRLMLVSAKPAE